MPVKYNVVERKNLLDKNSSSQVLYQAKTYCSSCKSKSINFSLIILFFLISTIGKAQSYGVHLNGHFPVPKGEIIPKSSLKRKIGFTVGGFITFDLNNLDIQGEVNYSQQIVKWRHTLENSQDKEIDLTMNYLELPIMMKKRIFKEKLGIMLGAQNSILLENPTFEDTEVAQVLGKAKLYRLGFLIGFDYVIDSYFLIQIRYSQGVMKNFNEGSFNNSVISLGIGILLGNYSSF